MRKFITLIFLLALTVSANAQFHGSTTYSKDLLNGVPMKLATGAVTNLPVPAYIGKDGFSVTPYFVATNADSATLAVLAYPMSDGVVTTVAPTAIGNVTGNGTTAVRASVRVAGTVFYGTGMVTIQLTNTHTDTITVSNVTISSW
jgi:hypothetical protein